MTRLDCVVPIYKILEEGKKDFQGSGVLMKIKGIPWLVTCDHIFREPGSYVFRFKGENIPIDGDSAHFLRKYGDEHLPKLPEDSPIYRPTNKLDVAFYMLPRLEFSSLIEFGDTTSVKADDELEYVGHNPDTGEKIMLSCKRGKYADERVCMQNDYGQGRDYLNLIRIQLEGIGGYSGGPIFKKGTNECIGLLIRGKNGKVSIIKGQTYIPMLEQLLKEF